MVVAEAELMLALEIATRPPLSSQIKGPPAGAVIDLERAARTHCIQPGIEAAGGNGGTHRFLVLLVEAGHHLPIPCPAG